MQVSTRSWSTKTGAMVLALALAGSMVASCSSSSKNSSTTGNSATTAQAAAFTGSPVTIMVTGPMTGPGFPDPNYTTVSNAAVATINAHGGAGGHQLKLVVCDNQNNASLSAACWQKLQTDPSILAVVGADPYDQASSTVITAAGAPMVSMYPINLIDLTSSLSFLSGGGVATEFPNTATAALQLGHKSLGLLRPDLANASTIDLGIKSAAAQGGGSLVKVVPVSLTSTDLTAPVTELLQAKPDAVIVAEGTGQLGPAIIALRQQGFTGPIIFGVTAVDKAFLSSLGVSTANLVGVTSVAPVIVNDPNAAVQQMLAAVPKSFANQADGDGVMIWTGFQMIATALQGMSTPTRAALTAKLSSMTNLMTGTTPPLDYTKPGPIPVITRVVNPYVAILQTQGTSWTWNGKFVDGTSSVTLNS